MNFAVRATLSRAPTMNSAPDATPGNATISITIDARRKKAVIGSNPRRSRGRKNPHPITNPQPATNRPEMYIAKR